MNKIINNFKSRDAIKLVRTFFLLLDKFIKMFVREKKSQTKLYSVIEKLYDAKVGSLTIIEDDVEVIQDSEVADMSLDTLSLIYKEAEDFYNNIEGIPVSKLKKLIQDIYMEALSTDECE